MKSLLLITCGLALGLASCKTTGRVAIGAVKTTAKVATLPITMLAGSRKGGGQVGIASVYKDHRTASGEPYRANAMACAHKTYPMGSRLRVTHLKNGRSVVVRVNDRGPYIRGRIIDLTPAAGRAIGIGWSIAKVRVERL